jgi:hypothetical protein
MTEKEFLIKFLDFCYDKYNPLAKEYHPEYQQRLNESTLEFLMEHHKEYFEVEFVKKEDIVVGVDPAEPGKDETVYFKGVPIVWDKEELELQSGLHSSEDILFK